MFQKISLTKKRKMNYGVQFIYPIIWLIFLTKMSYRLLKYATIYGNFITVHVPNNAYKIISFVIYRIDLVVLAYISLVGP